MSANTIEKDGPFGDAAPEILDGRIWVDGCWDFFHHGMYISSSLEKLSLTNAQDTLAQCFKLVNSVQNLSLAYIPTKRFSRTRDLQ